MKAIAWTDYGGPEVLDIVEVPKPVPKDDEILVKIIATTVNRTDAAMIKGSPFVQRFLTGLFKPRYKTTGTDFSGIVESVGEKVQEFSVGDSVWGFGDPCVGSHAQYLSISSKKAVMKVPEGVDHDKIVACAEGVHYAYNCINKVNIQNVKRALVIGATGAIGNAAFQMLLDNNIKVTAVTGPNNMDRINKMGAEEVINYQEQDFSVALHQKYDLIIDAVGKSSFNICKALLNKGGTYISSELGPGNENLYLPIYTRLIGNKRVVFPFPSDIPRSMNYVRDLLVRKKFEPLIDENTFPFERIKEAFAYVMSGEKQGNVIITYP